MRKLNSLILSHLTVNFYKQAKKEIYIRQFCHVLISLVAKYHLKRRQKKFSTYLCYLQYWRLSILGFGLFGGRCGWVQHEAGHGSFTGTPWVDKHIQKMVMGFGLSTSGKVWNNMHNRHHACTQKVGCDADLDTAPFVAFYNKAVENGRSKKYSKLWLRWQAVTFLPITSGILVMMFWIFILHPYKVVKDRDYVQAGWILSSHVLLLSLIHI